ncbi:hypothetical protein [Archaeoglobus neptunius]|uniref:hypothetical protein n=1 Tax=Archaeoglobus neptunius TaxID=2798580 RepID=UPI001925F384|nr:hypothetical protein [Archaeoglobus neptunius]
MRAVYLALMILILSITEVSSCIYEYRDVLFYPNQTQEVGKDWIVVNFTNSNPFPLYDIELSYRGETVYIPSVRPGENLKIDPYKTLSPSPFPLRIDADVVGHNITYTVFNDYSRSVDVNITIPTFTGFEGCDDCRVTESIFFNKTIPPHGKSKFTIFINTSSFRIPDGKIHFQIEDVIPVRYGVDVQISVEKEKRGGEWYADFKLKNNLSRDVNVSFEAWYVLRIDDHTYSNKTELFNETVFLKSGEMKSFSSSVVTDKIPVFYMRARARLSGTCKVYIKPVTGVGNDYIVGYAVLKGFTNSGRVGGGGGAASSVGAGAVAGANAEGKGRAGGGETGTSPRVPSLQPLPVSINLPSPAIPEITLEEARGYVATMLPASYGLFFAMVLFPLMTRRGVVVGNDMITPHRYALLRAYGRRLYSTPSNAFPGGIIITPDEKLVERFMNLGISRKDAECIAAAIKLKKPLVTSNREVAEIAANNGCIILFVGGRM